MPYKDLFIDWENPMNYFVHAALIGTSNDIYFDPISRLYSYKTQPKFEVNGFNLRIFNREGNLLYESEEYGCLFSCDDFNAFKRYTKEKGAIVLIDQINVVYPDNSTKVFSMPPMKY